jgi:hypothetical protein
MRFVARHIGSGVWGVFDAGVMGWRATDLSENDAHQQAADLNVIFNQYGQRNEEDHREVDLPIQVEAPAWSIGGQLDYWIKERREWWARVRGRDGRQVWIKAADLRPLKESGSAPVVVYPVRRTPTEWRNRLSLCNTSSDPACAAGRASR